MDSMREATYVGGRYRMKVWIKYPWIPGMVYVENEQGHNWCVLINDLEMSN